MRCHSGKVVLDCAKLEPRLREATRHVRDAADPSFEAGGDDTDA